MDPWYRETAYKRKLVVKTKGKTKNNNNPSIKPSEGNKWNIFIFQPELAIISSKSSVNPWESTYRFATHSSELLLTRWVFSTQTKSTVTEKQPFKQKKTKSHKIWFVIYTQHLLLHAFSWEWFKNLVQFIMNGCQ